MSLKKFEKHLKTDRSKLKTNPAKVGQAAYDILSKDQHVQEVGETIAEMTSKYFDELIIAAKEGTKEFESPFYVVILRKKETLGGNVSNVLFHRYVRRQTKPSPKYLRAEFPNADHDVYEIDGKLMSIKLLWTLPTAQDSQTILKNKNLYDPQLVKWIEQFQTGELGL